MRERGEIGTDYELPGSPSAGRDDGGQGRQIHFLRPLSLLSIQAVEAFGTMDFRVEVPDSRLRVNVALIGAPNAGASASFIGTKGFTLWLRAVEDSIDFGTEVPITNLWGTSAAPGAIPGFVDNTGTIVNDPNLGGWGKEFVTAGRAMRGTITTPNPSVHTGNGQLILQVRYTADAIRFPRSEWDEIRRACARSYVSAVAPLVVG